MLASLAVAQLLGTALSGLETAQILSSSFVKPARAEELIAILASEV